MSMKSHMKKCYDRYTSRIILTVQVYSVYVLQCNWNLYTGKSNY